MSPLNNLQAFLTSSGGPWVGIVMMAMLDGRGVVRMGLLYTPQHGYAAFTVPDFDTFMLRAVPELDVPEIHRRRRRR